MHTDTRQSLAQRPARSERPAHRSCYYDSAVIGTTPALRELASSSRGCPTFLHEASSLVEGEGSQENTAVGRAAGEEEEGIWEPADEVFGDRLLTLAVAEAFFFYLSSKNTGAQTESVDNVFQSMSPPIAGIPRSGTVFVPAAHSLTEARGPAGCWALAWSPLPTWEPAWETWPGASLSLGALARLPLFHLLVHFPLTRSSCSQEGQC